MRSNLSPVTSIDAELADKLERDAAFRDNYIKLFAQAQVAAELKQMRKARVLRQQDLARLIKTGQSAISRIEKSEYDGWTFKTLVAIAIALRAQLNITLKPIEDVAKMFRAPDLVADTANDSSGADVDDFAVSKAPRDTTIRLSK